MTTHAYRLAIVTERWGVNPQNAAAWTTTARETRIGECVAKITQITPRLLQAHWRWSVSRGHEVIMAGTARTPMDATDACERAAATLNESGWPSAFAHGGFLE